MMLTMTEPTPLDDQGRRTQVIHLAGRAIVVKELIDSQMMHMGRYARILQRDDIAVSDKLEAMERMLKILHSCVANSVDRDFLIEQEEAGELSLRDMMGFVSGFNQQDAVPVVKRRAPARRK